MPHSDRLTPPGICDLGDDTNPAGWVARCLDELAVTADAAGSETGAVPWFSRPSTGQAYAGPDRPISAPGLPGTARHIATWNPTDVAPMLAVDRLMLLQHLAGPDATCGTCGPTAGPWPCQPLLLLAARYAHLVPGYQAAWAPGPGIGEATAIAGRTA